MRSSRTAVPLLLVATALLVACGDDGTFTGDPSTDTGSNADGNSTADSGTDAGDESDGGESDAAAGDDTSTATDTSGDDTTTSDTAGGDDTTGDTGADTTVDPDDGCPDELFVQGEAAPENTDYDEPELYAYCEEGELVVESNGIIDYEFQPMTPNDLSSQSHEWRVTLTPEYSETATDIPLLGVVAFTLNGIPIYGPNEGPTPDPYGDPVYNSIVDWCMGHTAQAGDYHYHALVVECIVDGVFGDGPSPIIGYALDGFPIYGPRGCTDEACTEVLEFESGWVQTGDPTTYAWDNHEYQASEDANVLDACNGRFGPDGTYRYHATETFPYVLGCYHGVIDGGGTTDPGGPTSCVTTDDCVGECPDGSAGCTCGTSPDGNICQPTCTTADDCPAVDGTTFLCSREGTCIPAGGPPR